MLPLLTLLLLSMGFGMVDDYTIGATTPDCEWKINSFDCCFDYYESHGDDYIYINLCGVVYFNFENLTITMNVEVNGSPIMSYTFGLYEEPEICSSLLDLEICVRIDDIEFSGTYISGCLVFDINSLEITAGCFDYEI